MKVFVAQSCPTLCTTPWIVTQQAPLSMGFSKQGYWSGLPVHSPGDLPDPGMEPRSPALQADSLPSEPPGKPHRPMDHIIKHAYTLWYQVTTLTAKVLNCFLQQHLLCAFWEPECKPTLPPGQVPWVCWTSNYGHLGCSMEP